MTELTTAQVETRLREAVTLRKLMTAGYHPENARDRIDAAPVPQGNAIERAADALSWLKWLEREEAALVLARLEGARWKLICWRFDLSRPTAYRHWRHALSVIAWRLNGNALPAGCSRRRFMQLISPGM